MAVFDYGAVFLMAVTIIVFMIPVFIVFPPVPVDPSDALRQTHSKLGRSQRESNLRSQYDAKHQPQEGKTPKINSLHIYPIKSCRGIELDKAKILPTGLEHDRLYMFAQFKPRSQSAITESGGQAGSNYVWEFLTLRQLPRLANVKVNIWLPDASKKSRLLGSPEGAFVSVRFPWQDSGLLGLVQLVVAKFSRGLSAVAEKEFILPLEFPSKQEINERGYEFANVKIWVNVSHALNMSKELPTELATYLGVKNPLGIFRSDPLSRRKVFPSAPRNDVSRHGTEIDFQDAFPVHLLNLPSIRALELEIQKDKTIDRLDARRFRGNIVVSGFKRYDEDDWKSVAFRHPGRSGIMSTFDVSCRTVRCKLPNVDPATGIRHHLEPDRTLRNCRDIDDGAPKMGCLGMQLCPKLLKSGPPELSDSILEVGMEVDVLERGPHFYIKQNAR
ncbi:MOSC, beta barrel [Metarhizium rileyi]|uniref:MOSC, beta barrel n=1 Tax=Metarhizium rileyi (strain RCEF 4871) TaxID=1649241 RepID=A0A167HB25_METRR|nr:MOSC, beta barrel [Metarhizium rileyi RCEF 4871]